MPTIYEYIVNNDIKAVTEILEKNKQAKKSNKRELIDLFDKLNASGETALMCAETEEMAQLLINYGANVNQVICLNSKNYPELKTKRVLSRYEKKSSVLGRHLERVAEMNNRSHKSEENANKIVEARKIINLLLEKGADANFVSTFNSSQNSMISLAEKTEDEVIFKALIKTGIKINDYKKELIQNLTIYFENVIFSEDRYKILRARLVRLVDNGLILSEKEFIDFHKKIYTEFFESSSKKHYKDLWLKFIEDIEAMMHNCPQVKFKKDTAVTELVCKDLYRALYDKAGLNTDIVNTIKKQISDYDLSPEGKQTQIDFANKFITKQGKNVIDYFENLNKYKTSLKHNEAKNTNENSHVSGYNLRRQKNNKSRFSR